MTGDVALLAVAFIMPAGVLLALLAAFALFVATLAGANAEVDAR